MLMVKPKLREKACLGAADAMFSRQQIVSHLGRIQDGAFTARNLHVPVRRFLAA